MFSKLFFYKYHTFDEILWKSSVQMDMPHKTIRGMLIACWISKAINTHSEYVESIAPPLLQWIQESSSLKVHLLPGRYLLLSDSKSPVRQDIFLQDVPPRVFSADYSTVQAEDLLRWGSAVGVGRWQ